MKANEDYNKIREEDELIKQQEQEQKQEQERNYKRRKLIEEIITQEQNYIRDIELIVKFLIPKVEENVSKEDAQKMFINLHELVKINQQFLSKLLIQIEKKNKKYEDKLSIEKEECYGNHDSKLFKVFRNDNIVQMFQQYQEYNRKYQEAEEHRAKYEKDQKFLDAIQEAGQKIYMAKYQQFIQNLEENTNQYQMIITQSKENKRFSNTFSPRLQRNCYKFTEIIKSANSVKGLEDLQALKSLMIMPTQRLPRLELQFQELDKLSKNHPDKDNIKQLWKQFKEINQNINVAIKKQEQWKEIQKKFSDEQKNKIKPNQECILIEKQVQYRLAKSIDWQDCSLICLSDKIIIYRDSNPKKSIFGEFTFTTEISFIQDNLDDTYKEFQIFNSRKMYYFQVKSDNYEGIINKIEKQIFEFKEELKILLEQGGGWDTSQIQVTVEGTEEYDIATTNNYTVFIIKLSLQDGEIDWKIYKRFSELENIQNIILKKGWIPKEAPLKQGNWFSLHDNEHLKKIFIDIQKFIISIFEWDKFKKENQIQKTVLRYLGIPDNFISLPQIFGKNILLNSRSQSMVQQSEKEKILQQSNSLNQRFLEELKKTKMIGNSIRKKIKNFDYEQIQNEPEQQTSEDIYQNEKEIEVQIPYSIYKLYEKNQFIHPKIKSVLDSLSIKIKVDYLTKIIEMCEIIANFIRLKEFHDFRLVLIDSRGNKRMLDNDQIVLQSLPKNFVSKTSLSKLQIEQITYFLYFQKYIFFPPKIETLLFQGDRIRLIIINDHFFRELKFYQFTLEQYVLIYTLFVIIFQKYDPKNQNFFVLDTNDLDKLITQKIRKTQPDQFWQEQPQVSSLYYRLREVAKNQCSMSAQIEDEISYLARLALAKFAYQQNIFELFGTIQFYVGINIELENNKLLQDKLNLLPNVYLGITYNAIKLFNPSNKTQLKEFELSKVYSAIAEPSYIILEIIKSEPQKEQNVNQVSNFGALQKINRQFSINERQVSHIDDKFGLEMRLLEKSQQNEQIQNQKNGQVQIEKEKYKFKTAEAYRISQLIREYKSHLEI